MGEQMILKIWNALSSIFTGVAFQWSGEKFLNFIITQFVNFSKGFQVTDNFRRRTKEGRRETVPMFLGLQSC